LTGASFSSEDWRGAEVTFPTLTSERNSIAKPNVMRDASSATGLVERRLRADAPRQVRNEHNLTSYRYDTVEAMRRMINSLGVVVMFAIVGCGEISSVERIRRVEAGLLTAVVVKDHPSPMTLADRMAYYDVPGVSIAVINGGQIEWARGYGVLEAGRGGSVKADSRFQAASISKPITAMAALALIERGKLSLDDDVNLKLMSWHVPDNEFTRREKVTLRRLLNHSAGTTGADVGSYLPGHPLPTLVQALDGRTPSTTAPIRVDTVPGSTWRYSGGGYSIVQLLMTEVTGRPFPTLLQELVLNNVGMKNSSFEQPLPRGWDAIGATGHDAARKPIEGRRRTFPEMAAAGLWSTATDLARFAIEVQRSLHGQSNKVLSREMTRQMVTKHLGNYGLGLALGGSDGTVTSFSHAGANEGFTCMMFAYTDTGQGAVVMTNGDRGDSLFNEVLRAIAREYRWPDYRPIEKVTAAVDSGTYFSYVGDYDSGGALTTITSGEGQLYLTARPFFPRPVRLYPAGPDRFFILDRDVDLTFVRDTQTRVVALHARAGGETLTAPKVN
jgi:CubicO group peptidase (beta-lactamase class C family)